MRICANTNPKGSLLCHFHLPTVPYVYWENPNLEQTLVQLREAGWDGWEARQSLDWLGSARKARYSDL